jgi:tetratricopeptide (TPR) repeat protein
MKNGILLLVVLGLLACQQKPDFSQQLAGLEQRLAVQYTPGRSDSLVNLYREAIKAHPDDHALNLKYFTRAAEIQFDLRGDGVSAVRWINDAIVHQSKGQDLGYTMGVLTRIWNAHKYKTATTVKMDIKDIDMMRDLLRNNINWVDSAMVRLDRRVMASDSLSKDLAAQYIETAEGFSALTSDRDQFATLLLAAAGVAKNAENYNKAAQLYSKVASTLPESPKARTALFMQAVVYESDLQDLPRARKTYEEFLTRYPTDTAYADDVRIALKQLGMTPEQVVEQYNQGK